MTLYRQYRSSSFQELIGQDTVVTLLQNALAQGRLAHAYLFSGPRGTGKTSTARLLAKAATCLEPIREKKGDKITTFEACNICASCVSQIENRAQDIIEIDAASNRGIEDIRELREQASYPPVQLRYKIYIIDEVHMLTTEAFNALLKTLEEPAPQTIFILATTELHKVPATIRSRCQLLRFQSGTIAAITTKLAKIVAAEKWNVESEALTLIAEHAQGGFRDAETSLEQLATQIQPLTASAVTNAFGVLPQQSVEELLTLLLAKDAQAAYTQLATLTALPSVRPEQLTLQLITTIRRRIGAPGIDDLHLTYGLSQLLEAYILHRSSPTPTLPLEIACLNIAQFGSTRAEIQPIVQQPQAKPILPAIEQHVGIVEAPPRKQTPPHRTTLPEVMISTTPSPRSDVPVVELREVAISDIRTAWKEMILDMGREHQALAQMLRETIFHSVEEVGITIHVRFKFHVEKLSEKKNKARVEDLLYKLTHTKWGITYLLTENMPKRAATKEIHANASDAAAVFGSN